MRFFSRTSALAVLTTTAILGVSTSAEAANFSTLNRKATVTIGENFTGSTLFDSRFIPPDTMGGIGPARIVELINGRYAVYNKGDNSGIPIQSSSQDQFWQDAGLETFNTFDPRVIYDHDSQRWFATAIDRVDLLVGNNLLLGVSNSSDPTAGWTGFSLPINGEGTLFVDFPTLGVDADGVYLSAPQFNEFDLADIAVISIPKTDLLKPTPTVANATFFEGNGFGQNFELGFALQPAVDFGPSDRRAALLAVDTFSLDELNRTNLFNTGIQTPNAASLSATVDITTPLPTSFPPSAQQPGSKENIDSGDIRLSSYVIEQGNSLWAVQSVEDNNQAAIRWYEIDERTNAILQTGTISDPELDFYYPSIAVNPLQQVVIGFSGSGKNQFVSSYAVVGETVNGSTTFSEPLLLKEGVDDYERLDSAGFNRWGDYSATVLDPENSSTFWTFQEIVVDEDIWATQITEIKLRQPVPEPNTVIGLIVAFGTVAARKRS